MGVSMEVGKKTILNQFIGGNNNIVVGIIRDRQDAVIAFDEHGTTISRFPSKREAARQYEVSENSIRAAIKNKNKSIKKQFPRITS